MGKATLKKNEHLLGILQNYEALCDIEYKKAQGNSELENKIHQCKDRLKSCQGLEGNPLRAQIRKIQYDLERISRDISSNFGKKIKKNGAYLNNSDAFELISNPNKNPSSSQEAPQNKEENTLEGLEDQKSPSPAPQLTSQTDEPKKDEKLTRKPFGWKQWLGVGLILAGFVAAPVMLFFGIVGSTALLLTGILMLTTAPVIGTGALFLPSSSDKSVHSLGLSFSPKHPFYISPIIFEKDNPVEKQQQEKVVTTSNEMVLSTLGVSSKALKENLQNGDHTNDRQDTQMPDQKDQEEKKVGHDHLQDQDLKVDEDNNDQSMTLLRR